MNDAISRQSVIEMLDETRRIARQNIDGTVLMTFESVLDSLVNITNALPTIQPELHWIPVEQDTPTEDDDYWATFGAETGWFVDWCSWHHGRWVVWIDGNPADVSNVIAWCYPIEPYKGVTT